MSAGKGLKGKVRELGFFLLKVVEVSKVIEAKHASQDYPLNREIDELNYYFSAFLNTIQSIKDSCQTAMDIKISWSELSTTYGAFIFYCRNAITHDGSHMINSGQGVKNYITGPLRRISNKGNVIEFNPPNEDVLSLACNASKEILSKIKHVVLDHGSNIPVATEDDFKLSVEAPLNQDFIPSHVKEMIAANKEEILSSFKGVEIDLVGQITGEIELIESEIAAVNT